MAAAIRCTCAVNNPRISTFVSLRSLSTAQILASGHNRWSKIKHDKIKIDAVRSKERAQWSRNIQEAVKKNGGDPTSNSELSTLVAQAKKSGLPKDLIERAIAKGKGLSLSGDPLQTITVEAMLPPLVSAIIECQTDNKKRTLEDLRLLLKGAGGMITPTSHLFDRKGHIMLESKGELEEEQIMEHVIAAGALDMELGKDRRSLSVYTNPNETASIAQSLSASLGLNVGSSEIIWVARPESVVDMEEAEEEPRLALGEIISQIEGDSSVQAVYHNAV